jgi:hypothetical protein
MTRPPAKCGTTSGYMRHYKRGETPCDPCKAAHRLYRIQRRHERGPEPSSGTSTVRVPKLLLAEMYLHAPMELQDRVDTTLGRQRVDQLVRLYDAQEGAA